MATFTGTIFSKYVDRRIKFTAIIPDQDVSGEGAPKALKTLYLLNGWNGNYEDWMTYSNITRLAEKNNLAVIMPDGENSFYSDHVTGAEYGKFFEEELVQETRYLFPLSDKREDTFVAGVSMGGYGALRIGYTRGDIFGKVFAMSSPTITQDMYDKTPKEVGDMIMCSLKVNFKQTEDGDIDPQYDVFRLAIEAENKPDLFLACAKSDYMIQLNQMFHQWLEKNGIDHKFESGEGRHSWTYWNEMAPKMVDWLLDK